MVTKRLFVGLSLSPVLMKRLVREMEVLAEWPIIPTRKQNLHVTMLFLGFVAEENLSDIVSRLEVAVQDIPPFELHFDRIGYYPDQDEANLTQVRLYGEEHPVLLTLRQNLDRELGYLVPEKKSFKPHVTLGKVRRGQFEALPEKPNFEKKVNFVEPVSCVSLFESTTENGKRVFVPLADFPLEG